MLNQEIARLLKLGIIGNISDRCSAANTLLMNAMHINSTTQMEFNEVKKGEVQLRKIPHKGYNRPEYNLHTITSTTGVKDKRYHSTTRLIGIIL